MSIWDQFGGVREMLERDRDQRNASEGAKVAQPWKLMSLNLGRPEILSSHASEPEAQAALAQIRTTCAPFIRDSFWVEQR